MNEQRNVSLDMHVRGMGQSATLAINQRVRKFRAEGRIIYNMGLGQSPFPVPGPVVEALRAAAPEKDYLPVTGLPALREAVAEFHRRNDLVPANPDGVIIGPGSKELMFLVQVAFYGEIIIPTPCWVSYVPQARLLGRQIHHLHTTYEQGWRITAEQLQEFLRSANDDSRPRLLVLNYPANPSAQTYSTDELMAIAEIARRYDLIVLSDEIYSQLHPRGAHVSIARFYPEGTIISSGLSKWCGAGGWRLGTFCFPPTLYWLLEALASVASETYTSVCAPVQYAAVHAFRGCVEVERYLWHARRILDALGTQCADILADAGVRVHRPVGAFYLFPDFSPLRDRLAERGVRDSVALCSRVLDEASAAFLPGAAFGQPADDLTARMAYVDFDGGRAMAASENFPLDEPLPTDFTRHWCERVILGVEKVAEWVKAG